MTPASAVEQEVAAQKRTVRVKRSVPKDPTVPDPDPEPPPLMEVTPNAPELEGGCFGEVTMSRSSPTVACIDELTMVPMFIAEASKPPEKRELRWWTMFPWKGVGKNPNTTRIGTLPLATWLEADKCHKPALVACSVATRGDTRTSGTSQDGTKWVPTDVPTWEDPNPLPLHREVSSVNSAELGRLLEGHPNRPFVEYVLKGCKEGFRMGVMEPFKKSWVRKNAGSAKTHVEVLQHYIREEIKAGRMEDMGTQVPVGQVQPCGVISKGHKPISPDSFRITNNFSSATEEESVNEKIPAQNKKVKYSRIVDALAVINTFLEMHCDVYLAALDIKAAFRNLLVNPHDRRMCLLQAPDKDGVNRFYADRCIGFGCASSPSIFGAVSDAVHWIAESELKRRHPHCRARYIHLADDYLTIGASQEECKEAFDCLRDVLASVGLPEAEKKTVEPTQRLQYLGMIIDAGKGEVSIPDDKRLRLESQLMSMKDRPDWNPFMVAGVVGSLHFLHSCFMELFPWVADFYRSFVPPMQRRQSTYKPSPELRPNVRLLLEAVQSDPHSDFTRIHPSFMDSDVTAAVDAAGDLGGGGFAFGRLGVLGAFHFPWAKEWQREAKGNSSGSQELGATLMAVEKWGPEANQMTVMTDSTVAVQALAKGFSAKSPRVNMLAREILLACRRLKIVLLVVWHSRSGSASAKAADSCSRADFALAVSQIPALSTSHLDRVALEDIPTCLRS